MKREKENIVVWRKEHKSAMYAYKVYAKYDDITPNDFLHVQTDLEYRKQWDDTVAELEMIETDHFGDRSIIYWEIRWPVGFPLFVLMRICIKLLFCFSAALCEQGLRL